MIRTHRDTQNAHGISLCSLLPSSLPPFLVSRHRGMVGMVLGLYGKKRKVKSSQVQQTTAERGSKKPPPVRHRKLWWVMVSYGMVESRKAWDEHGYENEYEKEITKNHKKPLSLVQALDLPLSAHPLLSINVLPPRLIPPCVVLSPFNVHPQAQGWSTHAIYPVIHHSIPPDKWFFPFLLV